MKLPTSLIVATTLVVATASLSLAHSAGKKSVGPNGGRVMTKVTPPAEFFVTPDRKVQITFLDSAGRAVAPGDQVVTVTAGERSAPQTLAFAKSGQSLLSTTTLPPGNEFPAVVQVKASPSAKPVFERIQVNLTPCGECKHLEYACTCEH